MSEGARSLARVQTGPSAWSTRQIARVFFTLAALASFLYLLYKVRSVLELVLVAGFLAIALGPAVDVLVRHHVRRGFAILLVYLAILGVIFGVGLLIIPPVVDQVNGLSKDIPGYVQDLRRSTTFRCSIASASCTIGMIRVISIFSAPRMASISPSAFTTASAARCRNSSSMLRISLGRSRTRVFG